MIKKINVTCENCKESFIFTAENSVVDKVLDAGHYICFTCEDSNEEDTLEEIALAFGAPFTADKFRKEVGHILENSKKYHGIFTLPDDSASTDKLSVEKLQEELESCIQTLISVSILANGDENIVIGNFVDSRLSKLAKTHENVTKYIEKVTGKNIDVVLAENAALEAEEEE